MRPIVAPIAPGTSGPTVADLQDGLLAILAQQQTSVPAEIHQLGEGIQAERAQSHFGESTRRLVTYLQSQHNIGHLQGVVDDQTAAMLERLRRSVAAPGSEVAQPYLVRGHVSGGTPGLLVRAYDRDFRSEELVGEGITDSDGCYEIRYSRAQFQRAEQGSADLRIAVCEPGGRELGSSDTRFNVPPQTTINIALDHQAAGPSELERYQAALAPILQGVTLMDIANGSTNDQRRDLDFLAGDTGIDRQHLAWLVQAAVFAFKSKTPDPCSKASTTHRRVPPAAFYGWFRENLPADWESLRSQPVAALRAALLAAVEHRIIPAESGAQVESILDALPHPSRDELRIAGTTIGLAPATLAKVTERVGELTELSDANIGGLVGDKVLRPEEARVLGLGLTLHQLSDGHLETVAALREARFSRLTGGVLRNFRDLAALDAQDVRQALESAQVVPPNGLTLDAMADRLVQRVAAALPTDVLVHRVTTPRIDPRPALDRLAPLLKAHPDALRLDFDSLDLGDDTNAAGLRESHTQLRELTNLHPGLGLAALLGNATSAAEGWRAAEERIGWIRDVHAGNPELDLLSVDYLPESASVDRVDFAGLSDDARAMVVADLKAYQRVQRLSDNALASLAMLKAGYHSGLAIARSTPELIAARTGLPVSQAAAMHVAALDLATDSALGFFALYDVARNEKHLKLRHLPKTPAGLRRLAGFAELFGNLDYCICEHCQSVLSPAAYFVDLMFYVEDRILKNSFASRGGEAHGLHLKRRRKDLWDLDLTCQQTSTVIPYLSIVLGILEPYIQRQLPANAKPLYEMLADQDGSVRQPFVLPLQRLVLLLSHFGVDRYQIAKLFLLNEADPAVLAARVRARLGLTAREYSIITGTRLNDLPGARNFFENQLGLGANLTTVAANVETQEADAVEMSRFAAATGLEREIARLLARSAFVNGNVAVPPGITVDPGINPAGGGVQNDTELVRHLTMGRIDRIERFTRLWRHLPWTIVELDYVVAQLQALPPGPGAIGRLDIGMLNGLVQLLELQEEWSLPVDELNALCGPIPRTGLRNDRPLFDRLFNQEGFPRQGGPLPQANTLFVHPGQPLPAPLPPGTAVAVPAMHQRLLAALKVSDEDLVKLLARLDPPGTGLLLTEANLGLLYRHARLAQLFRLTIDELFDTIGLTPAAGASITSLAGVRAVRSTHAWRVASDFRLDEVRFVLGLRPDLAPYEDAAGLVKRIVAEAGVEQAMEFAATVFAQIGLTDSQSDTVVQDNISQNAADGKAIEPVPGTSRFRLTTAWDPEDPGAILQFGVVASRAMVEDLAKAVYDLAKSLEAPGFVKTVFAQLGMTDAESDALVDANTQVGANANPFERDPGTGRYRLVVGVTADNAIASFLANSGAQLEATRTATLQRQARALLATHHPLTIALAKTAAALQSTPAKLRAIFDLVVPSDPAVAADLVAAIGQALQGGAREVLVRWVGMLTRLSVLFKSPAFDAPAIAYAGDHRDVFGLPANPPASLTADLVLNVEALRRVALYVALTRSPDTAYEPRAIPPDIAALRDVLVAAPTIEGASPDRLARVLQTDRPSLSALLSQMQGQLSAGLDGVRQVRDAFGFIRRLGVGAETLRLSLSDAYTDLSRAADGMYGVFRSKYPDDKAFNEKLEPFDDVLRSRQRDALVDLLLHPPTAIAGLQGRFATANALAEYFLIDVQMEGCARTSRVVSALASLQLYVHRVLMNLERSDEVNPLIVRMDDTARPEWEWRQHYRVWEANRKVFLYPENYIEPSLRDDKTPLFRELEATLLQQEVTEQNVLDAYAGYLSGFDELARLRVAGAYHDRTVSEDILHLFGVTSADPPVYYYRAIRNLDKASATSFGPWTRLNVPIPVTKVSPIVYRGRLYAFWVETTTRPLSEFAAGSSTFKGYRHSVRIKYSQLRLDKRWSAPQVLRFRDGAGIVSEGRVIEDLRRNRPQSDPLFPGSMVPWDAHNREHAEAIETYRPDDWRWERVYLDVASPVDRPLDPQLRLVFFPRDKQGTSIRELADLAAAVTQSDPNSYPQSPARGFEWIRNSPSRKLVPCLLWYGDTPDTGTASAATVSTWNETSPPLSYPPVVELPLEADVDVLPGGLGSALIHIGGESSLLQAVGNGLSYSYRRLGTSLAGTLAATAAIEGITGLLAAKFQADLTEANPRAALVGGSVSSLFDPDPTSPQNPYLGYFREVFFQIPFRIADHLNSQQKFSDAQRWYHYVFDPTALDSPGSAPAVQPWRYREFRKVASDQNGYGKLRDILTDSAALDAYRKDPFNPHAIARLRPGAYQKSVVMKYIDNLLDWGDSLFNQFTMESVNEATMLYIMAADILGPRPAQVGPCGEGSANPKNYETIAPWVRDRSVAHDFLIEELELFRPAVIRRNQEYVVAGNGDAEPRRMAAVRAAVGNELAVDQPVADGMVANPMGWNQSAPQVWGSQGGTPLADLQTMARVTESQFTTGGTGSPARGFHEPPPEGRNLSRAPAGPGEPVNGLGQYTLDVTYSLADRPVQDLPRRRWPDPNIKPLDLLKSKLVFCIPENKELLGYWDRVEDRLYKIRNCMDISGVRRRLELFAPEIDPRLLVRMRAAGLSLDDVLNATSGNVPPYRFQYLIDKAKQHAGVVQSFGSQLLGAIEKRDAEELNRLRTVHEQNVLKLRTKMTEVEIVAAEATLESLRRQKAATQYRSEHYQELIQQSLSGWERVQQVSTHIQSGLHELEAVVQLVRAVLSLVPDLGAPTSMKYGGIATSGAASGFASASQALAQASAAAAASAAVEGSNQRRDQEWRHQVELANRELTQLDKQIAAAEIRRDIAAQALLVHQRSIDQSQEVFDFLRERFTSFDRYTYLVREMQKLHRIAFNAALGMARLAEDSYRFERPEDAAGILLTGDYWDAGNTGLLAGDRLLLDLQQLERRFVETNYRTLEVEQSFSLAQLAPGELIKLRELGSCLFSIPEMAFDLAYPGHYQRRIKAVRVSIPCVAGPYLNVGATLRLTGSRLRQRPVLADPLVDVPLRHTTAIATSSAQNDSGVFEFSYRDERFMPFEGAGAISDWELELPATFRTFDYRTISDVILRISYNAVEESELRKDVQLATATAASSLRARLQTEGLLLAFSLRYDFPDAWRMLVTSPVGTIIPFELTQRHLPTSLANWLHGPVRPARVAIDPKAIVFITQGTLIGQAPTANFSMALGAAALAGIAPGAAPGAHGLYEAGLTGTATLDAATPGIPLRLRLDASGNLAPSAGGLPAVSIDEAKLSDMMVLTLVHITP